MRSILALSVVVCAAGASLAAAEVKKRGACEPVLCQKTAIEVRWPVGTDPEHPTAEVPPKESTLGVGRIRVDGAADRLTLEKAVRELTAKRDSKKKDRPAVCAGGSTCTCLFTGKADEGQWETKTLTVTFESQGVRVTASYDYEIRPVIRNGVCADLS